MPRKPKDYISARVRLGLKKKAMIKALEMDTNLSAVLDQFLARWLAGDIELYPMEPLWTGSEDEENDVETE